MVVAALAATAGMAWFSVACPATGPALLAADRPPAAAVREAPSGERTRTGPVYAKDRVVLVNFDGPTLPRNGDGNGYPTLGPLKGTLGSHPTDSISGRSLRVRITEGPFGVQFNPYNYANNPRFPRGPRAFAREYAQNPSDWKFNAYNRMRFWIKVPTNGPRHFTNGQSNLEIGTYVKRVKNPDGTSDEFGGNHYYHLVNIPAVGAWTQVILNMHPDHMRGNAGATDPGVVPHPTREEKYNYFDALTRFYLGYPNEKCKSFPADFLLDEFEFYREPNTENDSQVYSLTATYVSPKNRLILAWNRAKADVKIRHLVRYAFSDIHVSGWKKAKPAPKGSITPGPESGPYNNMFYESTSLPLAGRRRVYIAIKPQNSKVFSQIVVPLNLK
jgi:hypothetical protein